MTDIHKILIPLDFSECSARALALGAQLGRQLGAEVTALHAYPPPTEYLPLARELWGDELDEHTVGRHAREAAQKELDAFRDRQPDEVCEGVEFRVEQGVVNDLISKIARKEGFDLIVVGSHGRHGVERWLMGSVAERLVRQAPCPVMVVH